MGVKNDSMSCRPSLEDVEISTPDVAVVLWFPVKCLREWL